MEKVGTFGLVAHLVNVTVRVCQFVHQTTTTHEYRTTHMMMLKYRNTEVKMSGETPEVRSDKRN